MTFEDFLLIQPEQKIYNPKAGVFAIVSSGIGLKTTEDIAREVATRLNEGTPKNWSIYLRDYIYKGVNIWDVTSNSSFNGRAINAEEHDEWVKISSVLDIDNQELINLLLMVEIARIKQTMSTPQTIQPPQPNYPPPINMPGIYVQNSLNLF